MKLTSDHRRGLMTSKVWDRRFSEVRIANDRPFLEALRDNNLEVDVLAALLRDTDVAGSSWEVEQVEQFLRRPPFTADARIWTECRVVSPEGEEHEPKWLNAEQLSSIIPPPRIQPSTQGITRRSLTWVPDLSPSIVTALAGSASWYQAQSLRSVIRGHVADKTSISVSAPPGQGFPIYRLELHLPYLVLKQASSTNNEPVDQGQSRKLWSDLTFLPLQTGGRPRIGQYSILQAHTSMIISGSTHSDWYGYALGDIGPRHPVTEEYEVQDDAYNCVPEEGTDEWFYAKVEDFFAAGGCQDVSSPGKPIMDPRIYFLRAVQHRLDVVVRNHEYLARKLEEGFHIWVKQHNVTRSKSRAISDYELEESLHSIGEMTKIFRDLRQRFSKANSAWTRFSGPRGDILYFEDLQDGNAEEAIHKIEESFEKLTDLEKTLDDMLQTCTQSANVFALYLNLGNHGMSRTMTEAAETAAESAKKSQMFAEETGRTTRVNIQVLMVTTAVVIALQYFCSDRPLFAFERNPRTFWLSICVLVPGLFLLGFALHTLDHAKVVFENRLKGRLEQAVTPTMEPVASCAVEDERRHTYNL